MSTYIQSKLRALLVVVLPLFSFISADAITPRERKFQFQYKATVKDIPTGTKNFSLWIPIPNDSPFQKIKT